MVPGWNASGNSRELPSVFSSSGKWFQRGSSGRGGDNLQIFVPYRMKEFQAPGMQMNAPVLVGTTGTIFPVSLYRPAGSGELGSYLVMPATEQQYFQQAIVRTISCNTVLECGVPRTGASRGNRSGNHW